MQGLCDFIKEVLFSSKNIKVDLMMNYLEGELVDYIRVVCIDMSINMKYEYKYTYKYKYRYRYRYKYRYKCKYICIYTNTYQTISVSTDGDYPVSFPWDEKRSGSPVLPHENSTRKCNKTNKRDPTWELTSEKISGRVALPYC